MAMTPEDMAWVQQQMQQRAGNGGQMALPAAQQPGMQGFGDITKNPAANKSAEELAGTFDDALGGALMMDNGTNLAASGHGVMSPFESAANGLKTAVGMGMIGKNIKSKQNAIKSLLRKPDVPGLGDALPSDGEDIPLSASGDYGFGD